MRRKEDAARKAHPKTNEKTAAKHSQIIEKKKNSESEIWLRKMSEDNINQGKVLLRE